MYSNSCRLNLKEAPAWLGVPHAAETEYLFYVALTKGNAAQYQLSKDMIGAWTTFAKTGTPGKVGNATWSEAVDRSKTGDFSTRYLSIRANKYKMYSSGFKVPCESFWKPRFFE